MRLYPEDFIEKLGGLKAFHNRIDEILDKINQIRNGVEI
jgi:hypothetical protein